MASVELYPGIVGDSEILGGKPVIKGTRVPVSLVLGKLADGMSMDEVVYNTIPCCCVYYIRYWTQYKFSYQEYRENLDA